MWTRSGYTKPFYDDGEYGITDMGYYVAVTDKIQGDLLAANLNTPLLQYIFTTAKWSGFGNERVFACLPHQLLNCDTQDIYSIFNITDAEQEYINRIINPAPKPRKRRKDNPEAEVRSQERSDNLGEVFTPSELVNEMLDTLAENSWDPDEVFIDPACGNGNFLVEVVKQKVKKGSTFLQALGTTYGIDIMKDNVRECQERLLRLVIGDQEFINPSDYLPHAQIVKQNIRCADSMASPIRNILEIN